MTTTRRFSFARPFTLGLIALASIASAPADKLHLRKDDDGTLKIFREGVEKPLVTQNARTDHRPYLHPITSPDGRG